MGRDRHVGVVVRTNDYGLCIVEDSTTKTQYAFTVDKMPDFRGEDVDSLGLRPGVTVSFSLRGDKIVEAQKK
jgi:hypothetical protein